MRLDHLLSKEEEVEIVSLFSCQKATVFNKETLFSLGSKIPHQVFTVSGGDAVRGHTRTHPEHDG